MNRVLDFSPGVTHPSLLIRDINDVHRVLQAVRLNILPLIRRRLTPAERNALQSGNVFVWEECDWEAEGLVRWTEGRRWSESRMRGDCLIYEEKIETTEEEKRDKANRRALKYSDSPEPVPPAPKRKNRPTKIDGLTKHTYSVAVKPPNEVGMRKWHLVAYFVSEQASLLPVMEDYEYLRDITIPRGVFGGHDHRPLGGSLDVFPRPIAPQNAFMERPVTPSRAGDSTGRGPGLSLRLPTHPHPHVLAPISPTTWPLADSPLPPLSSLDDFSPRPLPRGSTRERVPALGTTPGHTPEDRRILERFRVVL
uniref:cAMP-independent regulatory protein pac2 n=1 Tax=Mycena chlorophos TaxID=658473 RepID=A0ABQ0MAK0_MYCCL|nr:predicted protein [Mycena chlorophos]